MLSHLKKVLNAEFKEGQILKMDVAHSSHVQHPYYVLVKFYNEDAATYGEVKMITTIPGEHELEMTVGGNWNYHYPRMTVVGTIETHGHLLYNQECLVRPRKIS